MPYAYLDEAGAEARRARALPLPAARCPTRSADGAGRLDPAMRSQRCARSCGRTCAMSMSCMTLLLQLVVLPRALAAALKPTPGRARRSTGRCSSSVLQQQGRACVLELEDTPAWVAAERLGDAALLWPQMPVPASRHLPRGRREASWCSQAPKSARHSRSARVTLRPRSLVQGWLQVLGPTTSARLGALAAPAAALRVSGHAGDGDAGPGDAWGLRACQARRRRSRMRSSGASAASCSAFTG